MLYFFRAEGFKEIFAFAKMPGGGEYEREVVNMKAGWLM
jgi:hypothetical protein